MTNRWLSYPLLALVLLLAVFTAAHIVFAERPPGNCAPEDREIQGNTNSPCKWDYHFDEITSVVYDVAENTEGNTCHEVLVFSPYDSTSDLPPESSVSVEMGQKKQARGNRRYLEDWCRIGQ